VSEAPLLILAVLLAAAFVVYHGPWRTYQAIRYWWRLRRRLRQIRQPYQPLKPNG